MRKYKWMSEIQQSITLPNPLRLHFQSAAIYAEQLHEESTTFVYALVVGWAKLLTKLTMGMASLIPFLESQYRTKLLLFYYSNISKKFDPRPPLPEKCTAFILSETEGTKKYERKTGQPLERDCKNLNVFYTLLILDWKNNFVLFSKSLVDVC